MGEGQHSTSRSSRHPLRLVRTLRASAATSNPTARAIFRLSPSMQRLIHSAKIYRHAPRLHRRAASGRRHRMPVAEANRRNALLHPPHRLPRMRRSRRQSAQDARRGVRRGLSWGKYGNHGKRPARTLRHLPAGRGLAPNTMPSLAKAGANYMDSCGARIRMEAGDQRLRRRHRARHQRLPLRGLRRKPLSSSAAATAVHDHRYANSVLPTASRATTVLVLARALGIPVVEQAMPRELPPICDEALLYRDGRRK